MFHQEYLIIIFFYVSYYLFSNQEKDDSPYLRITDQIKKFLLITISNTVFPITRVPGAYSFLNSEDASYFMPYAYQRKCGN